MSETQLKLSRQHRLAFNLLYSTYNYIFFSASNSVR